MNPSAVSRHLSLGKNAIFMMATISPLLAADPKPLEILSDMKRVADWQIANPSKHEIPDWTQAPFFLSLASLYQVSGDARYLDALDGFGKQLAYGPGPPVTHTDDHAVLQAWLEMHRLDRDPAKMTPSVAHFDTVTAALAPATPKSISGGSFTWCWCDALFISPPVWAHLPEITGDPRFLEWADKDWWTTTDVLYDASDLNGKAFRETQRITLNMGQRLFQSDSCFTLDGKSAANRDVAIGLAPQDKNPRFFFSPKTGIMSSLENFDGSGLGTGVVIAPARVVRMAPQTDAGVHTQALCFARTDEAGGIRRFSSFCWEGQGEITTSQDRAAYLKKFASSFVKSTFANPRKGPNSKVHTLDVPVAIPASVVPAAQEAASTRKRARISLKPSVLTGSPWESRFPPVSSTLCEKPLFNKAFLGESGRTVASNFQIPHLAR